MKLHNRIKHEGCRIFAVSFFLPVLRSVLTGCRAVQAVLLRPASRACHGLMAALFSSCKSLSGFRPGSPAASFGRCIDDLENYCMFFRLTLVT